MLPSGCRAGVETPHDQGTRRNRFAARAPQQPRQTLDSMLSVVVAAWGSWLSFQALKPRRRRRGRGRAVRKVLRFWACFAFLAGLRRLRGLAVTWVPGYSLARAAVGPRVSAAACLGRLGRGLLLRAAPGSHALVGRGPRRRFSVLAVAHDLAAECAARPVLAQGAAPKTPLKTPPARDPRRRIAELLRDSDDSDDEPLSCVAEPGTPTSGRRRATRASRSTPSQPAVVARTDAPRLVARGLVRR